MIMSSMQVCHVLTSRLRIHKCTRASVTSLFAPRLSRLTARKDGNVFSRLPEGVLNLAVCSVIYVRYVIYQPIVKRYVFFYLMCGHRLKVLHGLLK